MTYECVRCGQELSTRANGLSRMIVRGHDALRHRERSPESVEPVYQFRVIFEFDSTVSGMLNVAARDARTAIEIVEEILREDVPLIKEVVRIE